MLHTGEKECGTKHFYTISSNNCRGSVSSYRHSGTTSQAVYQSRLNDTNYKSWEKNLDHKTHRDFDFMVSWIRFNIVYIIVCCYVALFIVEYFLTKSFIFYFSVTTASCKQTYQISTTLIWMPLDIFIFWCTQIIS